MLVKTYGVIQISNIDVGRANCSYLSQEQFGNMYQKP